jgi:tryptophan 2,3-dioxygenase
MKYWDYIKVEPLLSLQNGIEPDGNEPNNDEVLFITVHQIYELWFKLVLKELTGARELFRKNPVPDQALASATRSLRRVVTIFESALHHWRVIETLTTRDYLAFRDKLIGASGFQSAQLREIEVLLGLDDTLRISCAGESSYKDWLRGPKGSSTPALDRVERRISEGASYKAALYDWLARTPIDGQTTSDAVERYIERFLGAHRKQAATLLASARERSSSETDLSLLEKRYQRDVEHAEAFLLAKDLGDVDDATRSHRRHVRAALVFIESHRELPRLAWPREIIDTTLALEQIMIVWRQRHARMVERMIGRRTGTGGSGGVDYLDNTALKYRVFDDLWAVRTVLLREQIVPQLENEEDYRFRVED